MDVGRSQAVFVNKTGGGVTIDTISVPSGFQISSVISPTGTALTGATKYKGMWVNHEETATVNFKTSFNGFNTKKSGNAKITYTCEDDSVASHEISVTGTMNISGNFPSKVMCTIAFHEHRPRGHVLAKDTTNRVNGYPTYVDKTGKVYLYAKYRGSHLYWTFRYNGIDRVYHNGLLRSTSSNSGISADEALRSFPGDCSYYGNTYNRWGFDSKYNMAASSIWFTNANDCSYMSWAHADSTERGRVRLFFFQNVDAVGWSGTSGGFYEDTNPGIKHVQLRTDKDTNNRWIQVRTDNPGDNYNLREWMFHGSNGKAARVITQYGNFDVDTLKLGIGDPGVGFMEGYCKYRQLQVRREAAVASEDTNPDSNDGRMSRISREVSLPEYNFAIHKVSPNNGSNNGWASGRLTATSSIHEDCGYDTKYTITRTSAGTSTKLWYNEGATPSSNSNWGKTNGGKGTGLYTFDTPQGNGIKAHGKSANHTPLIFHKTGIPTGGRWRVKVYVMCVGSWDKEDGSVTINGKQQLTFRGHGFHMYDALAHNGASFSYKAGSYRNTPTLYNNSDDHRGAWPHQPRSVFLVSDWFTTSECTAQFNFNTNQGAEDESGYVSHMQIETETSDTGISQPLIDINRYVVMGVNQNKSGVLSTKKYSWYLNRGHNQNASLTGDFSIISNRNTQNAATYIRDYHANWGGVGIDKSTYYNGWQCCESGKGLGSYCNLYSPEDEIKDANGWGINELRKVEARNGTELFVMRYVYREGSSGRSGWHTTSVGTNGLAGHATRCWGCTISGRSYRDKRQGRSGPYKTDYGQEKRHLTITYSNPTEDSLQVEVPFRCHSFSDDYLTWSLYVYNHTTKQYVKSPNGCAKPPAGNGNPPGHWGKGDAATRVFGSFNGTIMWRATIPPKTTYEFFPGACMGHGWCQHEGGAAYWIGLEPKQFVK